MSTDLSGGEPDLLAELGVGPEPEAANPAAPVQVPEFPELPSSADLKFRTKRFALQTLLEKASSVLPQKDLLPVLKNFQVEAAVGSDPSHPAVPDMSRLRVVATDLELSVISTTEMVEVERPGVAVFPGKRMLDIIKEAEDGECVIDVVNGIAFIAIGHTTWELRLADGTDYPPLPEVADVTLHPVDRVKLLGAISSCRYAAATETVRPSLMMLAVKGGKMSACDGSRFQQVDLIGKDHRDAHGEALEGHEFPLDLQVPIGAIDDLVRLLRTTELGEVGVGESVSHLVFRVGADIFIANKLMAQFPPMEELLLKPALANTDELVVDRQELVDAVKRVRITADPETSAIILTLAQGAVSVESRDKFGNASKETVAAGWSKPDRTIVVNHQFLLDMLRMADAANCRFYLGPDKKSAKSPLLLRDSDTNMVGLIAQMRSDWVVDTPAP